MKSSRAIPFIIKNPQTQLYELSSQAQQFLFNINSPISVISVAGLYRTGKSYLLNRVILNKSQGFNVGPTINPCTKGLWIWNQSINTQDKKNVLVIDTQGLGALDQQANHDMKIFCLAVLLSTTFIYNSVGNIDQNALQTLSLVLNLVGNIDQQNQTSKPSFIWVVRDFSLQLVDDKGNTITPKQYLQMALNSDTVKQSQKAQIRKNITNAFKQRDCFTLYKPLIDQNKLQKLDTIPLEQLRPEFVSQTMALRKKIFSNLHQVKLSQSALRGAQYVMMVKRYLTAINQGKVPNINDTWTFIKQEKARQISYQLIQHYTQRIKSKIFSRLPMKFAQLQQCMSNVWSELLDEFKSKTYEQSSTQQIEQFFGRIKYQVKSSNEQQMKGFLKNLLTKQFEVFSKRMLSDYYQSIQELTSDIDKNYKQMLVQSYSQKVQGLNASISSFLQKKYIDAFTYFSAKYKLQIKRLSQNKEEIQQSYKRQIQTIKNNSTQYQKELKNKVIQMDRRIIQLNRKYEQSEKNLQMQKQMNRGKNYQTKNKIQSMQQNIMNLQQNNQTLQNQKKKIQKEIFIIKKQHQKQLALIKQKNDYLTKHNQDQQRRYQDMKKLLDQKMSIQQQQKKKYYTSNEQRFKSLLQQNQIKTDKIFELQQKILQIQQQYNEKIIKLQQKQSKLIQQKQRIKQNLINDFSNKKESHLNQLSHLRDQCKKYQDQLEILTMQKNQLQHKIKYMSQELKHVKYNSQKEIAIYMQRIQFNQAQIKQLKITNQQMKKNYQSTIQNISSSSKTIQQKYSIKIKQLTQKYQNQIKTQQKQFNQKLYQTKKQLSIFKTTKQNINIQLSLERKKYQNKEKEFKQSYQKLQELYQNLNQKLLNSQKDFHSINLQKQQYFTLRIKQLQNEIEQNKQKSNKELEQSQRSSQQALAVLKNYTQMERTNWQRRLQDQKQKNNRMIQNMKTQYEKKLIQQKSQLEQENSILEQKIHEMDKYYNETLQNMKYDNDIQMQKMRNEYDQQVMKLSKSNALLQQQIRLTKINTQKQIQQLRRNYEQTIKQTRQQLQNQIKQIQIKLKEQKEFIQSKYQSLKKSNRTVQQQNIILKNQLDKEKSLYKQKQSSYIKTINQIQQRLSHQLINHTKIIQEITSSNTTQRKRLNHQIDSLKLTKSKLQQQKSNLIMEKQSIQTNFNTKITYLQNRIKTSKNDYDDLMNKFQLTSSFLNKKIQALNKQKQQINGKLKNQFQQQINIKEDNFKKQNKDYNDRIYRLQTQNKSLRDKIILMEVKLASNNTNLNQQSQFEKLQEIKQEYMQRQQEYRKLIDKLKKENRKLKEQKQIIQLTKDYQKSKTIHNQPNQQNTSTYNHQQHNTHNNYNNFKDSSQRDSIINGLNDYSRHDASRSRINLDSSKMTNNQFNQSRMSNVNPLHENKTLINRKSNVSPMMTNKKYTNLGNGKINTRQQEYEGSRYY